MTSTRGATDTDASRQLCAVTDRRNGAGDVRRNGASFWLLNRAPEGVEGRDYFAAFAVVGLTLPAMVLGARYEAPSRTMQ